MGGRSKAFLMIELGIYLFLTSIALISSLFTFKIAWDSDSQLRDTLRAINDFRTISERIKYDLARSLVSCEVTKEGGLHFTYLSEDEGQLIKKDYSLYFDGSELIYLSGITKIKLSNKVTGFRALRDDRILTLQFFYGEEVYERTYLLIV